MQNEPDALLFAKAIGAAEAIAVSTATFFETSMVLAGRVQHERAWRLLDALIGRAKIEIVPFDAGQAAIA